MPPPGIPRPTREIYRDVAGLIEAQLDRKLKAMQAYHREMRSFPHPRSLDMLTAKAHSRGAQAGLAAAEAFVLLKEVV